MANNKRISFHTTREEALLIGEIISRASLLIGGQPIDRMEAHMDISACHANGCPLRLKEWLDAPDFDFVHDFNGIQRHIDRRTGQLKDCFLPRFAQPSEMRENMRHKGTCEFCGEKNTLLVATLRADPDQRVCLVCHKDPRIPTLGLARTVTGDHGEN